MHFFILKCANQFFVELSLSKSVKISSNFLFVTICQVIACRIGILNRSRVVLHQVYTLITHLTPTNQHQFNVVKLIWCQVIFDPSYQGMMPLMQYIYIYATITLMHFQCWYLFCFLLHYTGSWRCTIIKILWLHFRWHRSSKTCRLNVRFGLMGRLKTRSKINHKTTMFWKC